MRHSLGDTEARLNLDLNLNLGVDENVNLNYHLAWLSKLSHMMAMGIGIRLMSDGLKRLV